MPLVTVTLQRCPAADAEDACGGKARAYREVVGHVDASDAVEAVAAGCLVDADLTGAAAGEVDPRGPNGGDGPFDNRAAR